MQRRHLLALAAGTAFTATPLSWLAAQAATTAATAAKPMVEVWKDPNCGCCKDWIAHLHANGFDTKVYEVGNTAARKRLGLPERLGSCHTARVAGYVVEGHVPAADVHRLLKNRPKALGLAVPGMPVGSPGMDGPEYGGRKDPYDTLLVAQDGSTRVWAAHRS